MSEAGREALRENAAKLNERPRSERARRLSWGRALVAARRKAQEVLDDLGLAAVFCAEALEREKRGQGALAADADRDVRTFVGDAVKAADELKTLLSQADVRL